MFYRDKYSFLEDLTGSPTLANQVGATAEANRKIISDFLNADMQTAIDTNISEFENKPVHFRFLLNKGALYSFWVSPRTSGESRGYTAGGGPELSPDGVDL